MPTWNITADSVPVLDGWGWGDYWDVGEWIRWHELRKAKYGLDDANRKLLDAYHSATFGAASDDWKTFDTRFRDYAKANGFYDGLFAGSGNVGRLIGAFFDLFRGGSEIVESVGSVGTSTASIIRYVVPVLLIAGIGFGVWYVYRIFKT